MPLFQDELDLKKRKLRILFVTSNQGFCKFYRVKWPADYIKKQKLADVKIAHPDYMDEVMDLSEWADVIVFQYGLLSDHIVRLCEMIKTHKIPQLVVMEFDDDYFHIPPTNVNAYKTFGVKEVYLKNRPLFKEDCDNFDIEKNKKRLESLMKALIATDIITVTTDELGEIYSQYNQNVVALPNLINPAVMPINEKEKDDRIIIGWQGGDSHYADLALVMPVLERIKKKYGKKVHFKFIGSAFPKLYSKVGGEFVTWIRPQNFYERFSRMKIDIGIIPIESNIFNRGKSNIKWLEYSYYRIPSVVANLLPYAPHIKHGRTGYLYNTPEQMFIFINDLIKDPFQRAMLSGMAKTEVLNNWTIEKGAKKWVNLYKDALIKKIQLMNNLQ